LTILP